jgi:hypothetical protein
MMEEHDTDDVGQEDRAGGGSDDFLKTAATIGVIGVGAALIEVGLIPGMIIGVAAAYAPKYLPNLGERLQPLFRGAVRGAYRLGRKTKEAVAEAHEQVQDIVAEVHAEDTTRASKVGRGASLPSRKWPATSAPAL